MVADKAQPGAPGSGKSDKSGTDNRPRPRTLRPRRDWLAQGLREIYEETLNDPIPDAFKDLLNELERKEQKTKPADGDAPDRAMADAGSRKRNDGGGE